MNLAESQSGHSWARLARRSLGSQRRTGAARSSRAAIDTIGVEVPNFPLDSPVRRPGGSLPFLLATQEGGGKGSGRAGKTASTSHVAFGWESIGQAGTDSLSRYRSLAGPLELSRGPVCCTPDLRVPHCIRSLRLWESPTQNTVFASGAGPPTLPKLSPSRLGREESLQAGSGFAPQTTRRTETVRLIRSRLCGGSWPSGAPPAPRASPVGSRSPTP